MPKEIYISVDSHEKRVAVLEHKRIEEFLVERNDSRSVVGNIYKGRVESVLQGIGAAFVNLGLEKNGFLYVTDVVTGASGYETLLEGPVDDDEAPLDKNKPLPSIHDLLKKGDEVLVQVVKEPIRTKGARLTTHVSIPGRFVVLMPFDNHVGLSKRIEDRAKRDHIKKTLKELNLPKDMGFIVRTAAEDASKKDLFREIRYLIRLWRHISDKAKHVKAPGLVHAEHDIVVRVARDMFTSDVAKLEIDSRDEFRKALRFVNIYSPDLKRRLKLYEDKIPIFEKFEVERQIEKIYNRIVNLKSGGYIVFDETESLVAIDVNSGKFVKERNLEETAFKTNLEAADEIARQLRLRDLGGIIIIDFIDMEYSEHRKSVFRALGRNLERDKAKSKILNISSIGLVEMTRQRVRKSLEGKSYRKCPYCHGRGMIRSAATISIDLLRKIALALSKTRAKGIFVYVHPEVASYLVSGDKDLIRPLERRYRKTARIVEDLSRHIEDFKIEES